MYVGVDIGGTKTLIGVFTPAGQLIEKIKFSTSQDYVQFKQDLARKIAKLTTKQFTACAIGVRGILNRAKGILKTGGNALAWRDIPLLADVSSLLNCPVFMENDSKLAALSEASLVKDIYHKAFYLTISSGINGAFVVEGKLDQNTIDSEIGLMIYPQNGKYQVWENFTSGKAIVEKYGHQIKEINDDQILSNISESIAMGLINLSALFTPDVFIIGGGVGSHLEKLVSPLNSKISEMKPDMNPEMITIPPIIKAQRPEEAVIYGCYLLAKNANFS